MKKFLFLLIMALSFCICIHAAEQTVYVSGFGDDANPGTKEAPLRTIQAGFYALPHGGKLVLTSAFSLSETVNEFPEIDGTITITSFDGVTDYRSENGAKIYLGGNLYLRGNMNFEYVDFVSCKKDIVIVCNGHYTCFGEGINCLTSSDDINLAGITGGGAGKNPASSATVEIHSGEWNRVRGGQRGSTRESFDGDIAIAIYGGTIHEMLWLCGDIVTNGNANMFIYGGTFKGGVRLASAQGFSGDVNLSIYGGNFVKRINVSNGGYIDGNVTINVFNNTNVEIVQANGIVNGSIRIETTNPGSINTSLDTYILSAENAEAKKDKDAEFIKNTFTSGYTRHVPDTSYLGKALENKNKTLLCDVDASGYVSLFDALKLSLTDKDGAKSVLTAISKGNDGTYSLYGATLDKNSLHEGYAFVSATTENYKVSSSVTLKEDGIVALFFGCDKNSPEALNGYCIEADVAKNNLSAYEIIDGSYRLIGKKALVLLSNKAQIYVEYADSVANLYFDDNPLEKEQFFDFNFNLKKYGNEVGIYVRNGSATLPKSEEFANYSGSDTYTNELLYSFTDPDIFCENGVYYIYGSGNGNGEGITGNGINCFSTTDFENFKYEGQVLKKGDTFGESGFLCANIVKYGDYYYMFYSAYSEEFGRSPTACASSTSPTGPFTNPEMKPLTTLPDILGGQPFVDDDGTAYLIYTRTKGGNQTYGAKVILKDGKATLDLESEKFLLGITEPWEAARSSVVECGLIVKHKGLYYLLYAGGNYNSSYGVGYAVSKNPLGPYTKYENNPIFIGTKQSYGVGAASVFPSADGSEYFIIHLRHYSYYSVRPLQTAMDRFRFVKDPRGGADIIEICGPTVTPQKLPSATKTLSANEWQKIRFHP